MYPQARHKRFDFAYGLRKTWCLCGRMHTAFCINGMNMHGIDRKNCIKKSPSPTAGAAGLGAKERRNPMWLASATSGERFTARLPVSMLAFEDGDERLLLADEQLIG